MLLSAVPLGASFRNLLNGAKPASTSGLTRVGDGALGSAISIGSAGSANYADSATCPTSMTFGCIIRTTTANTNALISTSTGTGGMQLELTGSASPQTLVIDLAGAAQAGTLTIVTNVPYFVAGSCNLANTSNYLLNFVALRLDTGQLFSLATTSTSASMGSLTTAQTGGCNIGGFTTFGTTRFAAAMMAPVFLSVQQLLVWAQDPWSFWYPAPDIWQYSPPPSSATPGVGLTPANIFRPGQGPQFGLSTPRSTFIPGTAVGLFGYSAAMTRGYAAIAGQGPLAARGTAQAKMFSNAPTGRVPVTGYAVAQAKALSAPGGAAAMAGRGTALAEARAAATGAAAMAARGSAMAEARANATGVVPLAVRATAQFKALAQPSGAAGFQALTALGGAMFKASGALTGTVPLLGHAEGQGRIIPASSYVVSLLVRSATIAKGSTAGPTVRAALAALGKATARASAAPSGTAPLVGAALSAAKASPGLQAVANLVAISGQTAAVVTARGSIVFVVPPVATDTGGGRPPWPYRLLTEKEIAELAERETRHLEERIAAEQAEREEHDYRKRGFKRIVQGLAPDEPVLVAPVIEDDDDFVPVFLLFGPWSN